MQDLTEEMVDAGEAAWSEPAKGDDAYLRPKLRKVYSAMLAASPPPVGDAGLVERADDWIEPYKIWRTEMDAAGQVPAGSVAFKAGFVAALSVRPAGEPAAWEYQDVEGEWHLCADLEDKQGIEREDARYGHVTPFRALYPAPSVQPAEQADLVEALRAHCYTISERHLSGYRVILGFDTREAAQKAHLAIAALHKRED